MEEYQSGNVKNPISTNRAAFEKSFRLVTEDHPAVMNILVLDNIIRYLNYEDLKNLRLVCRRWKEVAKNVFWKMSRIKVATKKKDWTYLEYELEENALGIVEENQMLLDTFEKTFPSPAEFPTNAILFQRYINRRTLEYFWKERGSLTLTNVYLRSFADIIKEPVDLNRYITPKLTTLNIGFSLKAKFTVSLKMLANIQNLSLYRCEILVDGKIAPRELDLKLCSVKYEGKLFTQEDPRNRNGQKLLINNFVDFSKIKKLILGDDFWRLDVGSTTQELEHLLLRRVELVGVANSQWKTNYVEVGDCICVGDKMEIKAISGIDIESTVDLESLPKSLGHLWFSIHKRLPSYLSTLVYPKLKSLTIRIIITRCLKMDFTNCTTLIDFQLTSPVHVQHMNFNRIKLPNSIKNVKLHNVIPTSDVPWQLDTLILYKYPFSTVKSALRHFKAAKLVIQFDPDLEREEELMFLLVHWRNRKTEKLALGGIDMSHNNASWNSEFRKSVDERGRFFLFTDKSRNGKGVAVDQNRFECLSNLNLHKNLSRLSLL